MFDDTLDEQEEITFEKPITNKLKKTTILLKLIVNYDTQFHCESSARNLLDRILTTYENTYEINKHPMIYLLTKLKQYDGIFITRRIS